MALIALLLSHLQRPLNDYWEQIEPADAPARKGLRAGGIVFLIIGSLFWLGTAVSLVGAIAA